MPLYEYYCTHCQHELEVLQKFSDPALVNCPECGQDSLVKKISLSGFRLQGSGWYETDFKAKKPANTAEKDKAKTEKKSASSASNNKTDAQKSPAKSKTESSQKTDKPD